MEVVADYFNWIVSDLGDPRVRNWVTINRPWYLIAVVSLYVYLVKIGLPMWMKNRQAYDLKRVIQGYNILLLTANIGLIYGSLTSNGLQMGCDLPTFSSDPMSLRQLNFLWWTLQVKMLELIETLFYILRNKPEQASFLHMYHHGCVVFFMWLGINYFGGGMAVFPVMINSGIHVIMYSYYFLTSVCDSETRKKLMKFKKTLTVLQMVQFVFLMLHVIKHKYNGCPFPTILFAMYLPFVFSIFILFLDFFKNSYTSKRTEQLQKTTKML